MKYTILFLSIGWLSISPGRAQLSAPELDSFHNQALKRIEMLEIYIQTIADKKRSDIERDDAIKQAQKLFVNGATIEVSRSGQNTTKNGTGTISPPIPIRSYFQKLKNLRYDSVKVTNFNAARLDDWKQQPDGSYQATGQYFQAFKAWKRINGNPVPVVNHKDRKKIDVDLRQREDPFYKENHWMVLFENITIDAVGEAANN